MNRAKTKLDILHNNTTKKDLTIIHISDLHFSSIIKLKKLNKIKEEIYKNNPDYIMITGDLIDEPTITKNKYKIKELLSFLTDLSNHAPILISLGNHDVFRWDDYKFFDKLNALNNIHVLNNANYKDDYIYVSGFTLPTTYYYNITHEESVQVLIEHLQENRKLISKLPNNIPKVALIHSPIKLTDIGVLNKLHEYDLILSGHTHNGMVPDILDKLFKKNMGIIAPNKQLFPEIARGKIERYVNNKKITIIINGALTKFSKRAGKFFSSLNFIYNISINKIIITKKRGKYYE